MLLAIKQLILYMDPYQDFQVVIRYLQWLVGIVTDQIMAVFSSYTALLSLLWLGKKLIRRMSCMDLKCASFNDVVCKTSENIT